MRLHQDMGILSLEYHEKDREEKKLTPVEPYTEITNNPDFNEILIEIPGVNKEDVNVGFKEAGKKLVFTAESKSRRYLKMIALPFKSSEENLDLEVNNGIAVIKVRNKNF